MKQGKLIRRAVSAALAGCMMFTLSAPALAASTDALMQLSTAAKSAVNVLDEENGMTEETAYQMDLNNGNQVGNKVVQNFGIYVDDKPVTSENYQNLKSGRIVYDPEQKTLTAANRIKNLLKIRAPKTDVILNGGIGRGDLTIGQQDDPSVVGADDVTVTSDQYATIDGWAYINCTGKVNISSDEDMAVNGSLNISDSSEVILSADSSAVTGSANITSNGDVTIESTDGRAAQELTINKAQNVTITISDAERAVSEDTKITASGTVILKNNAQGGRVGTVDFTQADGKAYVYYVNIAAPVCPVFLHGGVGVKAAGVHIRKAVLAGIIGEIFPEPLPAVNKTCRGRKPCTCTEDNSIGMAQNLPQRINRFGAVVRRFFCPYL